MDSPKNSTIHTAFVSVDVGNQMAGNVLLRTAMDDEDQLEVLKPKKVDDRNGVRVVFLKQ